MQDFGKNIAFLRRERGLKQEEIADILGINRATWSDHERGKSEPPLYRLKAIADIFHISVDWLFLENAHLIAEYANQKKTGECTPNCTPNSTPIQGNSPELSTPEAPNNGPNMASEKDQIIENQRDMISTQKSLIEALNSNISMLKERLKRYEKGDN